LTRSIALQGGSRCCVFSGRHWPVVFPKFAISLRRHATIDARHELAQRSVAAETLQRGDRQRLFAVLSIAHMLQGGGRSQQRREQAMFQSAESSAWWSVSVRSLRAVS